MKTKRLLIASVLLPVIAGCATSEPSVARESMPATSGAAPIAAPVATPDAAPVASRPAARTSRDYAETIPGTAIAFDMVWVPEGNFWIGRTEVTWNEFLLYCDFDRPYAKAADVDAVARPSKPLDVVPYDHDWGKGRRPAVGISRNAARQYCKWLSQRTGHVYRLPNEAEWELACGDGGYEPLGEHAWFDENSRGMTEEVGGKRPNARGIHDMLGNLWEYCDNPYDATGDRAVLRGGSWRDVAADVTPHARLRFDNDWILEDPNVPPGLWWVPDGGHLGFRVIRVGDEEDDR